jgi:hypothetical protein
MGNNLKSAPRESRLVLDAEIVCPYASADTTAACVKAVLGCVTAIIDCRANLMLVVNDQIVVRASLFRDGGELVAHVTTFNISGTSSDTRCRRQVCLGQHQPCQLRCVCKRSARLRVRIHWENHTGDLFVIPGELRFHPAQ